MAKLHQEQVTIKISQLVRDSDSAHQVLDQDTLAQIEAIVQELAGDKALVEIQIDE